MPTNLPPDTLLTAIRAIVGDRGLLTDPADTPVTEAMIRRVVAIPTKATLFY